MAVPQLLVIGLSLGLGVVGAATASDMISLREVARAVDLPLISGAVIVLRESMPSSTAHALEPFAALVGLAAVAAPGMRRVAGALSADFEHVPPAQISVGQHPLVELDPVSVGLISRLEQRSRSLHAQA
jgi:hypothetical protein